MNLYMHLLNNSASHRSMSLLSILILSLTTVAGFGGCVKIPIETSRTLTNSTLHIGPPETSDTWLSSSLTLQQENETVKATLAKNMVRQTTQISKQTFLIKEKAIFAGIFPGLLSDTCNFDSKRNTDFLMDIMSPVFCNVFYGIPSVLNMFIEPFCEYGPGEGWAANVTLIGLYKNTKTSSATETVPEILNSKELSLPCPDVTVTLTAPTLGKQFSAKTNKEGVAVFDLLQIAPAGQSVDIIVRAAKVDIPPDEAHMKVSIPEAESN